MYRHFYGAANINCSPPTGNKTDKTRAWLNYANEFHPDPLATLGRVITELMEVNSSGYASDADLTPDRAKIKQVLAEHGLLYAKGGSITAPGATSISQRLQAMIRGRDLAALQSEFDRIYEHIESDPASAVTASCALLESLFRTYIEDQNLKMPSEQSIKPLWKVIRADLRFDPAATKDDDLKTVLTGLAAVVEGIGALRTHRGSAHGRGKTVYRERIERHRKIHAVLCVSVTLTLARSMATP